MKTEKLDWREDADRVLAALVEMEGIYILNVMKRRPMSEYHFDFALEEMKMVDENNKGLDENSDDYRDHTAIVYGNGGINRYYLRPDGSVEFSKFHNSDTETHEKAARLGFSF